jgi:hypothetical protein
MRSIFSQKNSRGMSLMSVLVGVALAGIVAAILSAVFSNISFLGVRSSQLSDADNLIRYIKGVLGRTSTCNGALRAAGPGYGPLVWLDVTNPVEVFRIQLPSGVPVVDKGQCLNPRLCVNKIEVRQPLGPPREGAPLATPWIGPLDTNYTIYSAVVDILFDSGGPNPMAMGGNIKRRTIAVNLARRNLDGVVNLCYQDQQVPALNKDCTVANTIPDCPLTAAPCKKTYFISGFDAVGVPKCKCQITCPSTILGGGGGGGGGKGGGGGGFGN